MKRVNGKTDVESYDWWEQLKAHGDWSVLKRTRCKAKRIVDSILRSQVLAESLSGSPLQDRSTTHIHDTYATHYKRNNP